MNDYKVVFDMDEHSGGSLGFSILRYNLSGKNSILHAHKYIQINYVSQGCASHYINGQHFDIYKGDIFIIPPMVEHRIIKKEEAEAEIIEFEFIPDFINQNFTTIDSAEVFWDFAYISPFLVESKLVKPRFNLSGALQIEVERILNEALLEMAQRRSGFELMIKTLLLNLLIIVGREFTNYVSGTDDTGIYASKKESILNAINYINENYKEPLRHAQVAKNFFLSPSQFNYLFKYFTSKTFGEYLTSIRMAHALQKLRETDSKIIEIAMDVGYHNINHFNRAFKQYMNMTPSRYRKKSRMQ